MTQRITLILAIIIFLLLLVPYFENVGETIVIKFFGAEISYHSAFWILVVGGMLLGVLTFILVRGFVESIKDTSNKNKFEL